MDSSKQITAKNSNAKLAVRFDIKLEESTDEKCPEISYADLLLKHEMRRKRTSSNSRADMNMVRQVPSCAMFRNMRYHKIVTRHIVAGFDSMSFGMTADFFRVLMILLVTKILRTWRPWRKRWKRNMLVKAHFGLEQKVLHCCKCSHWFQGKSYISSTKNRYVDLGDGYDSDDSFIDNEEAVRLKQTSGFFLYILQAT